MIVGAAIASLLYQLISQRANFFVSEQANLSRRNVQPREAHQQNEMVGIPLAAHL